ncbi:ABC transporter domain-containing protein [Plasmodiophora brassicae]|uniref:ABC transporter domain-containing protein n=1 Tax=Plasmodiophora brassicae TaxID=37360 RepID=A0A0G4IK62_PLABS|nr:hypothetical protein PBRA_004337 [Plasmodiophora brassicae]
MHRGMARRGRSGGYDWRKHVKKGDGAAREGPPDYSRSPSPDVERPDSVQSLGDLRQLCNRMDGSSYGQYKRLRDSSYALGKFTLTFDHIQPDGYAPPSRCHIRIPLKDTGLPETWWSSPLRRIALSDYLTRRFHEMSHRRDDKPFISVSKPTQQVLQRNATLFNTTSGANFLELRPTIALPSRGRTILGNLCGKILTEDLVEYLRKSLLVESLDEKAVLRHIQCVEDSECLRDQLSEAGLVAFIGDGSILPRRSGVSDLPMPAQSAVRFRSPDSMAVTLKTRHSGAIRGMGVPVGVNLIVGGGYHGKSTLLEAIEMGVYNHVPGDGREHVVSISSSVKIRAEDGRSITHVDISPFISNLPQGRPTTSFTSEDASGSTSQAAAIIESLELGAQCLLIDEDTSATNFMIRDMRMQLVVSKDKEPITPFIARARSMLHQMNCSCILVVGGCADYFAIADRVIQLDNYVASDVTDKARQVVADHASTFDPAWQSRDGMELATSPHRDLSAGYRGKNKVMALTSVLVDGEQVDLSCLEQLVDRGQTQLIVDAVVYLQSQRMLDGRRPLREVLEALKVLLDKEPYGLDAVSDRRHGAYSRARLFEIGACINRLRKSRS